MYQNQKLIQLNKLAETVSRHVHLSTDEWVLTLWEKGILPEENFRREYDKIIQEAFDTDRNTTSRPKQIDIVNNVLTLTGMTESLQRDDGEKTTTNRYGGVGTNSTAETQANTTLNTEDSGGSYSRRDMTVAAQGSRSVTNQTATYQFKFTTASLSADPITIKEAGIFTALTNGVMHCRATFTNFIVTGGADQFIGTFTEVHANGTL